MSSSHVDFKCVLLGRASVGKTCLVERFLHSRFATDTIPTVGAAFGAREIELADSREIVTIGVWDTAGSERYESMTRHYYTGADAAVICFDLTSAESWEKVKFWHTQVTDVEPDVVVIVVGTKSDLLTEEDGKLTSMGRRRPGNNLYSRAAAANRGDNKRAVPVSVVQKYCNEIKAKFFETSALKDKNIEEPFAAAASEFKAKPPKEVQAYNPALALGDSNSSYNNTSGEEDDTSCC